MIRMPPTSEVGSLSDYSAKGTQSASVFVGITLVTGSHFFRSIGETSSCPKTPEPPAQRAPREKSVTITFGVEFSKPPTVTAWLTRLDIDKNYNGRWIIDVSDITTTSCVITFKVWCNTYVYSSIVAYQAIG